MQYYNIMYARIVPAVSDVRVLPFPKWNQRKVVYSTRMPHFMVIIHHYDRLFTTIDSFLLFPYTFNIMERLLQFSAVFTRYIGVSVTVFAHSSKTPNYPTKEPYFVLTKFPSIGRQKIKGFWKIC